MLRPRRAAFVAAVVCGGLASGCGGAAPLMHSAHVLDPGRVTVGGGFAGQLQLGSDSLGEQQLRDRALEEAAVSPGLAPWVSARLGIEDQMEAGLTYTGRSARVDGRYAFELGESGALSLGLGASGLLPKRRDDLGLRVGGFGADLPVLLGWRSSADIYSLWLGARGGGEVLNGQRELPAAVTPDPDAPTSEDIEGYHAQVGGLVGLRVGFRYLYAALELGAAMHFAEADIGPETLSVQTFALSPSGALIGRF
jgi:hypothetical protein